MNDSAADLLESVSIDGDAVEIDGTRAARLIGTKCAACGTCVFPPVAVCPECMSEELERHALSATGSLYSWSVVHAAPKGWRLPYIAGYVDLPEEVRVFAHIEADPSTLAFDMDVTLCLAQLGTDEEGRPMTGFAFRPLIRGEE